MLHANFVQTVVYNSRKREQYAPPLSLITLEEHLCVRLHEIV